MQAVDDPWLRKQGVHLDILRLDTIHPTISGNKWYKLKYNLRRAQQEGYDTLLTVGGAYSNHIYAMAAAGRAYGFHTIGLIRGEAHQPLNPTLRFAQDQGMQLHYLSRDEFRQLRNNDNFLIELQQRFGRHYYLPEGGANALAVRGCTEIVPADMDHDYVACCVGTGGTLAGITISTAGRAKVLGFSALKGSFLSEEVDRLTQQYSGCTYDHYQLVSDYHFGGYARVKPPLIDFINRFYRATEIPLDPIYTGKMMYGLYDMIEQEHFAAGDQILAVHSGGLQGVAGFNERYARQGMSIKF